MEGKLLFDLECTQPAPWAKRHGGGIYGEIVLRKLIENNAELVVYYNSDRWLNPDILQLCQSAATVLLVDRKDMSISDIFAEYGCKRLFSPLPGNEFINFQHDKIGVIHGLRSLELNYDSHSRKYPLISFKRRLKFMAESLFPTFMKSRHKRDYAQIIDSGDFIVVSNHTAAAIKVWFPQTRQKKIEVFYSPSTVSDDFVEGYKSAEPYILMVSGNRWEKNTIRAIQAIEKLIDNNMLDNICVYITGLKNFKELKHKMKHPERFRALGYVDDDILRSLYKSAYAFIYPSLNEGFGYPPLEAMHYGVPAAVSATSSIPEICGDGVLYFNPYDIDEIANRIVQLTDQDTRQRLSAQGKSRADFIRAKQEIDLEKLSQYLTR